MDGFDGATIFLSFILTIFVYLLVPILSLGINGGKKFDEKKAKKIALWNSIIVGFIFCVLTINSGSAWSAAPALFYYFINKKLLTEKDSSDSPEDAPSDTNVVAPQYKKEEPYVVQQPKITSAKPVQTEFKREEPFKDAESKPLTNHDAWFQKNARVTEEGKLAWKMLKVLVSDYHVDDFGAGGAKMPGGYSLDGYIGGTKIESNGYALFDCIFSEYILFRYDLCRLQSKEFVINFTECVFRLFSFWFEDFYNISSSTINKLFYDRGKQYENIIMNSSERDSVSEKIRDGLFFYLNKDFVGEPFSTAIAVASVYDKVEMLLRLTEYRSSVWKRLNVLLEDAVGLTPSTNSNTSSLDQFISQNNIEVTEAKKAIPEVSIEKTEPKPEPKKQVQPDSEYDRRITELERQLNELKAEREAERKANANLKEDEEGQMYIDF